MTIKELKKDLEKYPEDVNVCTSDKPREPVTVHYIKDEVKEHRRIILW